MKHLTLLFKAVIIGFGAKIGWDLAYFVSLTLWGLLF